MRKLALSVFLLAFVCIPGFAQEPLVVTVASGDPVVLGVSAVLTGEGLAPLGEDIVRGIDLAITRRPSVFIEGVEFVIETDVQDDLCSAEGGQAIANYFTSNPQIAAVLGPTCSSSCRAASSIFDPAGYTSVSGSCTNPGLAPEFEGFVRTTPNDDAQGVEAAIFIFDTLRFAQIATIHDGSPYGEGLVSVLEEAFESLGGEIVYSDAITVGDTDLRSVLDAAAAAQPELIFFGGFPAEAARIAEQRADAGIADVPMMGGDGLYSSEFINLSGITAEGVYVSTPAPAVNELYGIWLEDFMTAYGSEPNSSYSSYAADAVTIVMNGIEAVGTLDSDGNLVIDRAELRDYILNFGSTTPYVGLSGVLSCNGDGECAQGGIGFYQVQNGQLVRLDAGVVEMGTVVQLPDIVAVAGSNPNLSTLVSLIESAGLTDILASSGARWTVFAPSNAAFAAVPQDVMDQLASDPELLTQVLTYHVVEGILTGDQARTQASAPTMEMAFLGAPLIGSELTFSVADDGLLVDGIVVSTVDIPASNGIIHIVDSVLLPADVLALLGD